MSPKANTTVVVTNGQELKLIFPQPGAEPELYAHLDFLHFYLQPMDNAFREFNTQETLQYCLNHPKWRLSLQTHKLLGIP
jgi:organic radical activating enzyme